MVSDSSYNKVCNFCGSKRTIYHAVDDGRDYLGHQRGFHTSKSRDDGCSCDLGKLEHNKLEIKKMCLNCTWYLFGDCNNKEKLKGLTSMFDIDRLKVKSPTKSCDGHNLDINILKSIIK